MHLTAPEINAYAEQMTSPESEVLATLSRETYASVPHSNMLSGHLQGALLQMLSHIIRPKTVLEIGTYTGYSAICLAQGVQPGGHVHTIDIDAAMTALAQKHWLATGLQDIIVAHTGRAADIIPTLPGPFDIVFIDADKKGYPHYFDLVIDKIPAGGIILADNVLQRGDVLLPPDEQRSITKPSTLSTKKLRPTRA